MIDYSEDNRLQTFERLRENRDKYGYTEELLKNLEENFLYCLNEINLADRNNKFFMEPLLYAFKNSKYNSYEIYKFYGDGLKKQELTMAIEIVTNEPEVLEDTVITDTDTIVLYLVPYNPEIILYISDDLKKDGEFIEELCETGNQEAIMYAARTCNISEVLADNSELANNPEFMKEAIKEDVNMLSKTNEELRNNHEFIREICLENKETIDYVAEHTEEFGKEGLNAAKEVLVENSTTEAIVDFEEELKRAQEERAIMESQEGFDKDSKEYKDILLRERHARSGIRVMERIKNTDDPRKALERLDMLCKNMDEEYRQKLIKYFKLDDAVIERQKEENNKKAYRVNAQASMELGNNTMIIEPELGANLEDFARQVIELKANNNYHIITKFNGFEIDSDDFETVEDVINKYMIAREEYKKNKEGKNNSTKIEENELSEIEPKNIEKKVEGIARLPEVEKEVDIIETGKMKGNRAEELTDDID